MKYLLDRLTEPSTWAAISAIAVVVGLPPGTIDAAHMIAGGIASLATIFLPEKAAQ